MSSWGHQLKVINAVLGPGPERPHRADVQNRTCKPNQARPGERSDKRGMRRTAPSSKGEEEPQTKVPSLCSPAHQTGSSRNFPYPVVFVDVGMDGPSSHKNDKGSRPKPSRPLGAKVSPICRRLYCSTKVLNKHVKVVGGRKFGCSKCPKKSKTESNRVRHKKNCTRSPQHPPGQLAGPSRWPKGRVCPGPAGNIPHVSPGRRTEGTL